MQFLHREKKGKSLLGFEARLTIVVRFVDTGFLRVTSGFSIWKDTLAFMSRFPTYTRFPKQVSCFLLTVGHGRSRSRHGRVNHA
jgi:hypothetical protein